MTPLNRIFTLANPPYTVWKFHDFTITQMILREINFGDSRSAKSDNLTHLNFDFLGIFALFEG